MASSTRADVYHPKVLASQSHNTIKMVLSVAYDLCMNCQHIHIRNINHTFAEFQNCESYILVKVGTNVPTL